MALPFILAGLAALGGGYGIKKGFDAKRDLNDAEQYQNDAVVESEEANEKLEIQKQLTNISLENYGQSKIKGIQSINLFDSFICYPNGERRGNQLLAGKLFAQNYPKIIITYEEEMQVLKDLHILETHLSYSEAQHKIKAHNIELKKLDSALKSIASGSLAGLAAGGTAYLGVGTFAAASTGTAISGLSGAAATNATLAWLGGGSIASGGLGIAGGTAVLGGLVAGPLLAIGGAVMASKAAAKKDEAFEHLQRIRGEIRKLEIVMSKLYAIERYTDECRNTFDALNDYFTFDLLRKVELLAQYNLKFKDLSERDREVIYASYELSYMLYDFIHEPTMNKECTNALPKKQRKALYKSNYLQYTKFNG